MCVCVRALMHANPSVLLFTLERRSEALSVLIAVGLRLSVALPYVLPRVN